MGRRTPFVHCSRLFLALWWHHCAHPPCAMRAPLAHLPRALRAPSAYHARTLLLRALSAPALHPSAPYAHLARARLAPSMAPVLHASRAPFLHFTRTFSTSPLAAPV